MPVGDKNICALSGPVRCRSVLGIAIPQLLSRGILDLGCGVLRSSSNGSRVCGRPVNAGHCTPAEFQKIPTRVPTIACLDVAGRRSPSSHLSKNWSICRDFRHVLRRHASQRPSQNPPYNQQVIGSSPVAPTINGTGADQPDKLNGPGRPSKVPLTSEGNDLCVAPYQPIAAMIGALRCVPAMPPYVGASPKG